MILSKSPFFFFLLEGKEKKRSKARRGWILSGSKVTTDFVGFFLLLEHRQEDSVATDRTKKLTDRQTGRLTTDKIDKETD